MKFISNLAGDDVKAKYSYLKFYLQEFGILILKAIAVFSLVMCLLLVFFFILSPDATSLVVRPVFQVKKSNPNSMITIYTNQDVKKQFCLNQSLVYYGKLYTKQQFCQFQHQYFPFQVSNHDYVDVSLIGMNKNVIYITACLIKINQDRSVCQKFAYNEKVQIFNNLQLEHLYSIQIELDIKTGNEFFGEVNVQFEQENNFLVRFIKDYYFWVSILTSLILSLILTFSFALFQIPDILQKAQTQDKKAKAA